MKDTIKKAVSFLFNKKTKIYILRILLNINKKSYNYMTNLSMLIEGDGKHPKHRIMKYREWFAENLDPEWVVLDLGCHNGDMTHFLSKYCSYIYGLELSKKNFDAAIKNNSKENIKYIHADATVFDYSGKKIDCVTLSNVLEHIENREFFLKKILLNINWVKKPMLLIRVPMIDRDWLPVYQNELGLDYRLDTTHFTEFTLKSLTQELAKCDIKIISYHVQWGEIYAKCVT